MSGYDEMVDIGHLRCPEATRVGSTPANRIYHPYAVIYFNLLIYIYYYIYTSLYFIHKVGVVWGGSNVGNVNITNIYNLLYIKGGGSNVGNL